MNGFTCSFTSRCPTEDELQDESLKWFTLSDEQHWDPTAVTFNSSRRNISTVEGRNYNTPVTHSIMFLSSNCVAFKDDVFLHEIDKTMATISSELTQDIMVDRLISNVQVNSRYINATYTDNRHHGTDKALLSRKWGIGLKAAKDTLSHTTQLNIRSAISPLTRRYRTDLVSQRLRRLSCRFYTDTAFAKEVSMVGNNCAQIFTYGQGFVIAFPMKSKEDAGDSLQKLCRDVGVPIELHSDNANEMTQDGTKF